MMLFLPFTIEIWAAAFLQNVLLVYELIVKHLGWLGGEILIRLLLKEPTEIIFCISYSVGCAACIIYVQI